MIPVLSLLSGLAQAISQFFGWKRDHDLMQAGEDRARKEEALDALRKIQLAQDAGGVVAGDSPAVRRERLHKDAVD